MFIVFILLPGALTHNTATGSGRAIHVELLIHPNSGLYLPQFSMQLIDKIPKTVFRILKN